MIFKMEYNIINNMIVNEFQSSIAANDAETRNTIFNSLYSWYMKNYAYKIKQACLSNNEKEIRKYAIEIENICTLSDIDKLKITFYDPEYQQLLLISDEIFNRIKDNKMITDDEYNIYVSKLEEKKSKINEIYKKDCEHIISECMLDLEYLKRDGNFEYYSLRFNQNRLMEK